MGKLSIRACRLGLRSIKTTLAVFVCLVIYQLIYFWTADLKSSSAIMEALLVFCQRNDPIFACIAAIIVMQNTIEGSLEKGISRVIGTFFGGLIGLLLLYADIFLLDRKYSVLIIPLGVLFIIYSLNFFGHQNVIAFSLVAYLVIMITVAHYQIIPYLYAIYRTVDTSVGVLISFAINYIIARPKIKIEVIDMSVKIREAEYEDLDQLLTLYSYLNDNPVPKIDERVLSIWDKILKEPQRYTFVAADSGRIAATVTVFIEDSLLHGQRPFALVEYVVTHPDYRGRGLAIQLLQKAEDLALENSCYKMMLVTGQRSENVHRLYRRAGYNGNEKTAYYKDL